MVPNLLLSVSLIIKGNMQRVLASIKFQHAVWRLRGHLPKPDCIVSDFAGLFGNIFLRWKKRYGTRIIYDILDLYLESFIDAGLLKETVLQPKYYIRWNIFLMQMQME